MNQPTQNTYTYVQHGLKRQDYERLTIDLEPDNYQVQPQQQPARPQIEQVSIVDLIDEYRRGA